MSLSILFWSGVDKTWGRPWPTLWPTLWPTGGQIFLKKAEHCRKSLNVRTVSPDVSRFAYKSFRLQVDSPTLRSFRLHGPSRFAYI